MSAADLCVIQSRLGQAAIPNKPHWTTSSDSGLDNVMMSD